MESVIDMFPALPQFPSALGNAMFGIGIVLVIVIIACAFERGPRGISVPLTDLLLAVIVGVCLLACFSLGGLSIHSQAQRGVVAEAEAVAVASIASDHGLDQLRPEGHRHIQGCWEGSGKDLLNYSWTIPSGDSYYLVKGAIQKEAEQNGSCVYTLLPPTSGSHS